MISRRTYNVPKEDVVFPRLRYCDSRCSQTCCRCSQACHRCSQVHPKFSPALWGVPKLITITPMIRLYQSSEIPVIPIAGRNALLWSDTLLELTHLSLHSTSSQTLLEAPSDWNTFCWWICSVAYWVMKASHGCWSLSLHYWPPPSSKIQIIKGKTWIQILLISQPAKHAKCAS